MDINVSCKATVSDFRAVSTDKRAFKIKIRVTCLILCQILTGGLKLDNVLSDIRACSGFYDKCRSGKKILNFGMALPCETYLFHCDTEEGCTSIVADSDLQEKQCCVHFPFSSYLGLV